MCHFALNSYFHLRRQGDQAEQNRRPQPPGALGVLRFVRFQRSEYLHDRVAKPFGRAPAHLELALHVGQGQPDCPDDEAYEPRVARTSNPGNRTLRRIVRIVRSVRPWAGAAVAASRP